MNIKRAKEELKNTIRAYLAKNSYGEYEIPVMGQRPVLLMGPPGIGKTQIMEQVARECGIGLVAYTITHHTRQSAIGLPFISEQTYGEKAVSVTQYTMSEIVAAVYNKMEETGLKEGILFIDEINCVSETLAPTMLQFLQCKTFGNQAVPAGWVIVAAGNPPEYNKSVRDFDIVTLDRVRRMDIEPDLPVWKDYARAAHIHSAILSYLELHPQNFYQINADVDGTQFVTARGWEDLSNLLDTYETLGLQADEDLIREYIQHPKIAEDFSAYLDLYYKYRDDYGVEEILAGQAKPAVFARLLQAPFDERLSLVSLILAGLGTRFTASRQADAVADSCYAFLRETKKALATVPEDIPDGSAEMFHQQIMDYDTETQQKRAAGLLSKDALTTRLQVLAERRAGREPLQYLLGEWDFLDFTLKVGRGVLCPRADSEVVCETAIELLKDSEAPVVYDLCAGTGCLGLGIARAVPSAKVTCVELSHDAWPYLTANVAALGGKATQAERGDVMNYYTQIEPESADLIISNPPYLTAREMQNLMPETAREPAMALDGGADGLDFYRVLVRQYYDAVRPGGWLVLEIGYAQAEAVLELGKAAGWQAGTCRKDAGGNDRVVFFRKPLENPV